MVIITLKNGEKLVIREAEKSDAFELLKYIEKISGESDNLTFGKGEFGMTLEDEEKYLESSKRTENSR